MKCLSIKQPYATLIANGSKLIETRSWRTNYLGEILIHASAGKIPREWRENALLMGEVKESEIRYGEILCRADLVDCIEMTEEFIEDIKRRNPVEFICGFYEVGRFAWVLENVELFPQGIKAKGKLGIWEYKEDLNYGEI